MLREFLTHLIFPTTFQSRGSGLEIREYSRRNPLRWPRDTLYPQNLALTLLISGGRSIGVVISRMKTMEFSF
jgi:hypothetical protein